jgi:hypothetical protein
MLKFPRTAVAAVTALAIAAPAAAASDQSYVSPDAADTLRPESTPYVIDDGRSPDTKLPRTNDTVVLPTRTNTVIVERSEGFDLVDAGIGAAGGVAVIILAGAGVLLVPRRRRVPTTA